MRFGCTEFAYSTGSGQGQDARRDSSNACDERDCDVTLPSRVCWSLFLFPVAVAVVVPDSLVLSALFVHCLRTTLALLTLHHVSDTGTNEL